VVLVKSRNGEEVILAVNCGSSSLKFGLYDIRTGLPELFCEGTAEEIGSERGGFHFRRSAGDDAPEQAIRLPDHKTALEKALEALQDCDAPSPSAVGHRIVHGGPGIRQHRPVTDQVMGELGSAICAFAFACGPGRIRKPSAPAGRRSTGRVPRYRVPLGNAGCQ